MTDVAVTHAKSGAQMAKMQSVTVNSLVSAIALLACWDIVPAITLAMPGQKGSMKRQALAADDIQCPNKGQKTLRGSQQGSGVMLHDQSNCQQPTTSATKPPSGVDNTTQDEDHVS